MDHELISHSEIGEFQKIVGGFIDMVDALAKEVEKEKMKVRMSFHLHCLYLYVSTLQVSLVIAKLLSSLTLFKFPLSLRCMFRLFPNYILILEHTVAFHMELEHEQ